MARVLAATVVLPGEDGPVVLLAGDTPTEEQSAQITNPKAWADAEVDEVEVEEPAADVEATVVESAEDADSVTDQAPAKSKRSK